MLAGKKPGAQIGKLSPEQAEIARLPRELEISQRRLGITEVALGIIGKAHELLEELSRSSNDDGPRPENVGGHTYRDLVDADVPSRAAALRGHRTPTAPMPRVAMVPANTLSSLERAEILSFVNLA